MLNITGVILILIQFVLDGWAIQKGTTYFADGLDILGWFLFGLIGVCVVIISQAVANHRVSKAMRKVKRTVHES